MRKVIFLLLIALFLISGCIQSEKPKTPEQAIAELPQIIKEAQDNPTAEVSRVIDGDTLELEDGRKVRLIGINTPEKNEKHYLEAKQNLEALVLDKEVFFSRDVSDKDKYGRLLRYVFTEDEFVNAEQISAGLASSYEYEPDTKYQFLFNCLEEQAREKELGIWQGYGEYNFSIQIHQNPDDVSDPSLEYITLTNIGSDVNLSGWQMKDEATHIYTFKSIEIENGQSITVNSGSGNNTDRTLYWNSKTTIWNNDGDTVFLRDAEGNLAAIYPYS